MKGYNLTPKTILAFCFFVVINVGAIQGQSALLSTVSQSQKPDTTTEEFDKFRLSINGGYSYRISKIDDSFRGEIREYMQEIKSGKGFSAEAIYYFRKRIGIGLKYALHQSSNSAYLSLPSSTRVSLSPISDDISISFLGPLMGARFFNQTGKNALIIQYGIGYVGYKNNSRIPDPLKITGGTLGSCTDLGYEMQIIQGVSLGLQISYLTGNITRIKYSDGYSTETRDLEIQEYEGVSRFDLLVGLRFSL